MITLKWEMIDSYHKRAPIPGGWLVKAFEDVFEDRSNYGQGIVSGWQWRVTMCFVPDPNHEWGKE